MRKGPMDLSQITASLHYIGEIFFQTLQIQVNISGVGPIQMHHLKGPTSKRLTIQPLSAMIHDGFKPSDSLIPRGGPRR